MQRVGLATWFALFGICGCQSRGTIQVAEETLYEARIANFPYKSHLARAETGDKDALSRLLRFSLEVDAASAIGHGVVLYELLQMRGDQEFAEVIRTRSEDLREAAWHLLEVGEAYQQGALDESPSMLATHYPLTRAAIDFPTSALTR